MSFSPPLRLQLDGGALVSNWQALARLSGSAATGAAVKANGYGLGAREVVKRLSAAGCMDFFVAHWAEAEAIADIIPPSQISVLNGISQSDITPAIALSAVPVINTPQQAALWKAAGGGRCHVMLDSGINRMGIGPEQMSADLFDGLEIDILMSHLASADEDVAQNEQQLASFLRAAQSIPAKRRSLANSAGIMLGADYHFDLTRPGLSLYGGIARSEMADFLKQVVFPQARVLQIRSVDAGQPVGYNATYTCSGQTRVAIVAIGYADGYFRNFSNCGSFECGGKTLPVVGRVSMDLVTLDINQAPELCEGDWVNAQFNLLEASRTSGQSQYELLTSLGSRYDRIWS